MSEEQEKIDNLLAEIDFEPDERGAERPQKSVVTPERADDGQAVNEGDFEIEYIRFDNPTYHLKYKSVDRTLCGRSTNNANIRRSDREPDLLDPCKPCHGETRVTTNEEQMVELRDELAAAVPAVDPVETDPGEFTVGDLEAILAALPTTVDTDPSNLTAARRHLSRGLEGVGMNAGNPGKFDKTELDALVQGLSGDGIVPNDPNLFIRTNDGLIKRTPVSVFPRQRRGGKGQIGIDLADNDRAISLHVGSPQDTLLVFTTEGQVHELPGYEIPEFDRVESGTPATEQLSLGPEESVQTVTSIGSLEDAAYLVMATREGYVKRTATDAFENILRGGIQALELDDLTDDELRDVQFTDGETDLFLGTQQGRVIRFEESDVRPMGRSARGPKGIQLEDGDQAVGIEAIRGGTDSQLLTITNNGYGKRTEIQEYRQQSRHGKGLQDISTGERNGVVADIRAARPGGDIVVLSERGQVIVFPTDDVSVQGRNTKGVSIMSLEDSDRIAGFDIVTGGHSGR